MPDIKSPSPFPTFGPGPFTAGTLDTHDRDVQLHAQLERSRELTSMARSDATADGRLDVVGAAVTRLLDNRRR
jgi:hypothetical protein